MFKYCTILPRYVGLVVAGVQEQADDILVPPLLLRNWLTLATFPCPSHYLPSRTVVLAIVFYCLDHSKNVYDDDDLPLVEKI